MGIIERRRLDVADVALDVADVASHVVASDVVASEVYIIMIVNLL
jgi:hypothetical protein